MTDYAEVTITEPGRAPRTEVWEVEKSGAGLAIKPPKGLGMSADATYSIAMANPGPSFVKMSLGDNVAVTWKPPCVAKKGPAA